MKIEVDLDRSTSSLHYRPTATCITRRRRRLKRTSRYLNETLLITRDYQSAICFLFFIVHSKKGLAKRGNSV